MAFHYFFQGSLTEPLIEQLMAILQRDFAASLATVDSTLPVPLEWNLAYYEPSQYPALLLTARDDTFTDPGQVQGLPQRHDVDLTVTDAQADRNKVTQNVWKYMLAAHRIIASLGAQDNATYTPNKNDFYSALSLVVPFPSVIGQSGINLTTAGLQAGSVLSCVPIKVTYGQIAQRAQGWAFSGTMTFRVETDEAGLN